MHKRSNPSPRPDRSAPKDFWPKAFAVYERRRGPLKLGVHLDIAAALKGAISDAEIKVAPRAYTGHAGYLLACREGASRVDRDGTPAGTVIADESAHAAEKLALLRKRSAARHQATQATAPGSAVEKSIESKPTPRRLSLADLRAAARARREAGSAP
jgi:ProP effector